MTTTLKDIRQRVGLNGFCGDTTVSEATSLGTTTTIVDASLKQPDDFFNGASVVILTGSNAGAVRYVTDFDQSTSTLTLDRALSAAVASGVEYELHRTWHPYDKNNAANEAIRVKGGRYPRWVEDTSLTFTSNVYTYSLASLSVQIDPQFGLEQVLFDDGGSGTGYPYAQYPADYRLIRTNGDTLTLQLLTAPPRNSATIRLVYRVRPAQLSADSDLLAPQDEAFYNYVCYKAAAILFRQRSFVEPESEWAGRANAFEQAAEGYLAEDKKQTVAGKVRFGTWDNSPVYSDRLPTDYGL